MNKGKAYTVRYEAVNAMLLNEFLKEHRKVQEQDRKVREQQATISQLKSVDAMQETTIAQTAEGNKSPHCNRGESERPAQFGKRAAQLVANR